MLTPFGVEFRYPGEQLADFETARQALQEAQRLRKTVLDHLQSYLIAGRPPSPGPRA